MRAPVFLCLSLVVACNGSSKCEGGTSDDDDACAPDTTDTDVTDTDTSDTDTTQEGCVLELPDDTFTTAAPPEVYSTCPKTGAVGVDPNLDRIEIAFSRPMQDGSWSWVQVDDRFPDLGDVYFESELVHVGEVELQPNSSYALWLNYDPYVSFVSTDGQPAVPYFLEFETGSGD